MLVFIQKSYNYSKPPKKQLQKKTNKIYQSIYSSKQNYTMFSITSPTQIKNNQLNTSSAKYHWSFSKAPRFKDPNPTYRCNKISYQSKSTISSRRASIGYGNRSAYFQGRRDTIEPCRYNLSTSFQGKKGYSLKGFNFGYNRAELNFSNYLNISEKTPGPAKYQKNQQQVKSSKAYSLRPKTSYPKNYFLFSDPQAERVSKEPGPGVYETIDGFGSKYFNTKSKNLAQTTFIGKQRFTSQKETPGPADYHIYHTIQPDGRCTLSNMRGSGRRAIMSQKRQLKLAGNKYTPGPGTYRQPSDFGHYQKSVRPQTARR